MGIIIPGTSNILLFIGAAMLLLVTPGPAVFYVVTRSVAHGRIAGLVSALGIHTATLVHVIAASAGLSALIASSALAFGVVTYAGAAYLIWLGIKKIMHRPELPEDGAAGTDDGYLQIFRDGFIVNLLNPKTALFIFAFLPQFVDTSRGHIAMQIAFLGLLFAALGLLTDGCYALVGGTAGNWLRRSRRYRGIEPYMSGALLIGLGVIAAFAGSQKK